MSQYHVCGCHCGATFPSVLERIAECSGFLIEGGNQISGEEIRMLLQGRLYFDLAGVPFPDQVHGLLRIVDSSRLLYGSDYPFTRAPLVEVLTKSVDEGLENNFGPPVKHRVLLDNAKKLLKI